MVTDYRQLLQGEVGVHSVLVRPKCCICWCSGGASHVSVEEGVSEREVREKRSEGEWLECASLCRMSHTSHSSVGACYSWHLQPRVGLGIKMRLT